MNKIQECVEKLLEVIREDSAYQRYLACEEMLKSNPELKKQIDEFRVAVFHMNNDDTQGDLYDITDEVENRYEKLRKVPEVMHIWRRSWMSVGCFSRYRNSFETGLI